MEIVIGMSLAIVGGFAGIYIGNIASKATQYSIMMEKNG